MNILIINCSPVRNGATAEIINIASQYLHIGNTIKTICIDDFDIKYCKGCRKCHTSAECFQHDDTKKVISYYEWANKIISVSPSYWADIPGQFKVFIDRCTPWCNTHEPHAKIPQGKQGYTIALRTGQNAAECEKIIGSIEHFYGHLEINACGSMSLCSIENKADAAGRADEIKTFCNMILNS